jgi:cation/acetate symporter
MAIAEPDSAPERRALFKRRLNRIYLWYAFGFVFFTILMAVLEQVGVPKRWIGVTFLLSTVVLYACIGIISRTTDANEYYVAGRRVPAVYNGMATGADWMSAASFIGLAGTLYLQGYAGLAFILGWTGGYCLVGLLIAPYLRKFGEFTIPDFLGARYGSDVTRLVGIVAAVMCSFIYVVAQIYGVGLITTRLTGVDFVIGIFLGLGGILVCSFLGGMRAVTWTQVAQYIILIVAFSIPVVWLSVKQTGVPLPQLVYGSQLAKVTEREHELMRDPKELEVIAAFKARAESYRAKLENVPFALAQERRVAVEKVADLKAINAPLGDIQAAEKALAQTPKNEDAARELWKRLVTQNEARAKPLAGMPPHGQQFAGDPKGTAEERQAYDESRRNFLALVFCLMLGTAGLPHILVRSYTTPTVKEARQSVAWSLFFISLLYVTAPALAVLVKFEVFNVLVGTPWDQLPAWISNWSKVDPSLMSVVDVNHDGVLQLGEMKIGADIVVLATPEIGGLPYVVSALVAAGGLAAALSTADGLLLTIANALGHDFYYKIVKRGTGSSHRVTVSKVMLLVVALAASALAASKPVDIVFLVSAAFSVAASAFVPALVLGVFWSRANRQGAIAGMVAGLGLTVYYMVRNEPWLRGIFHVDSSIDLWWSIQPISAAVFGVPLGLAVMVIVTLLTPAPSESERAFVKNLRIPKTRPAGENGL